MALKEKEKSYTTIGCHSCGQPVIRIFRHTYATEKLKNGKFVDDGTGYSELFCANCEVELSSEVLEQMGLM